MIKNKCKIKADAIFFDKFGRHINWKNPVDLNEKINWLKFHAKQNEWAQLADKYLVRKHLIELGLGQYLLKLYGKFNSVNDLFLAWDMLPDEFVIKSNNGCGHVIIIRRGGKNQVDKKWLASILQSWLNEHDYGLDMAELHYQYIDNCILVEEYLRDDNTGINSRSLVDYKIWCFNGKPYGCLVVYDRDASGGGYTLDYYDIDWVQHSEYMTSSEKRIVLPKPELWGEMLAIAARLSCGHPQVRVDLYFARGQVYFGEMTFTSAAGFMTYFTEEQLIRMGNAVRL